MTCKVFIASRTKFKKIYILRGGLNGQTVMRFQASITGQSIGGGYQVLLGSCAGDFGSFSLTRS